MGPGGYPRPTNYNVPEKFVADMVLGILLIIGSGCVGLVSLLAIIGGGLMGVRVVAASGQPGGATSGGAAVAATGTGVMIVGVILLILCIGQLVGAIWMLQSLEKGLRMIMVLGIAGLILGVVSGVMFHSFNFVGIGMGLIYPIYCGLRLGGQLGPKPIT